MREDVSGSRAYPPTPEGVRDLVLQSKQRLDRTELAAWIESLDSPAEAEMLAALDDGLARWRDPVEAGLPGSRETAIEEVMERLRVADGERRAAIAQLVELGAVRSRGVVADLGEAIAAVYYGVELEPPSTPGYDLVRADGAKVQVKTLRSTPPHSPRTSMGALRLPYDVLLAIRLDADYRVERAIEVRREVVERHYAPGTRTSWTRRLELDPKTRVISATELLAGRAG